MNEGKENGQLARSIGLFALIVYGVGDMIGAGIYGTIGVAAGKMGNAVWLAFLVSMVAALLTGLSVTHRWPLATRGRLARRLSPSARSDGSFFPMSSA